jgi:hypothetical protein
VRSSVKRSDDPLVALNPEGKRTGDPLVVRIHGPCDIQYGVLAAEGEKFVR